MPATVIFDYPTVADLADFLADAARQLLSPSSAYIPHTTVVNDHFNDHFNDDFHSDFYSDYYSDYYSDANDSYYLYEKGEEEEEEDWSADWPRHHIEPHSADLIIVAVRPMGLVSTAAVMPAGESAVCGGDHGDASVGRVYLSGNDFIYPVYDFIYPVYDFIYPDMTLFIRI